MKISVASFFYLQEMRLQGRLTNRVSGQLPWGEGEKGKQNCVALEFLLLPYVVLNPSRAHMKNTDKFCKVLGTQHTQWVMDRKCL